MEIKYTKGGNKGSISIQNTTAGKEYLAVTAVMSRWYKTLKGAEKFMEKYGYVREGQEIKNNKNLEILKDWFPELN